MLPPLVRAFGAYVARVRDPYLVPVVLLRGEVDEAVEEVADSLFADVEAALAEAVEDGRVELAEGADTVRFDYDTRLVLPAMLTLGRIHERAGDVPLLRRVRRPDEALVEAGRAVTREIVCALLDGDMRDAINDDEFEDFETTVRPRRRAAEVAQATLQARVEAWLEDPDTPPAVEGAYRHAVDLSERHQATDRQFRDLLEQFNAATGDPQARIGEEIEGRYKYAEPDEEPALFEAEYHLPYFATQYERVGVLYEDMLRMYEAALGIDLGASFKRAIVLMVIAAQVGLDDVDDYPEDRGDQLTPVTAELALAGPEAGLANLRRIVEEYLSRAGEAADSHLAGMAIEYIRQDARARFDDLESSLP